MAKVASSNHFPLVVAAAAHVVLAIGDPSQCGSHDYLEFLDCLLPTMNFQLFFVTVVLDARDFPFVVMDKCEPLS